MAERETYSHINQTTIKNLKNIPYNNIIFIDFGAQGLIEQNSSVTDNNTLHTT